MIIVKEDNVLFTKKIQNESIDLVLTSPPYDSLRDYSGEGWDFENLAKEIWRVTRTGGVVVWIVSDATVKGSETGSSFRQALYFMSLGFNLHDTMIWNKPTFTAVGALKTRYAQTFEYMFVFVKGKLKTFNPIKDKPNKYAGTKQHGTIRQEDGSTKPLSGIGKEIPKFGQRHNVWDINPTRQKGGHPATFPLKLAEDHIISWTNEGDTVFDPFLGSGTSAIASIKNNRKFIGCDISEEYINMAIKNVENYKNEVSYPNPSVE